MNRDPKTRSELCATTEKWCAAYSGAVPYSGRKVIPGTVKFEIGTAEKAYFEGIPEDNGNIEWRRTSGTPLADGDIIGKMNLASGYWDICFNNRDLIQDGEQITVSYDWQPHHLSGAEVLIRINNEERFVPIGELQSALYSYLDD